MKGNAAMLCRKMRWQLAMALTGALAVLAIARPAHAQSKPVPVAFVGCASTTNTDDVMPAPTKPSRRVLVAPAVAGRLAYYETQIDGVLAPRGWRCLAGAGSSGSAVLLMPGPARPNWKTTGPAILMQRIEGGTSGRFSAAQIAAKLFPVAQDFVQRVMAEGLVPKEEFAPDLAPTDRVVRRSDTMVEFTTPANREGLGTNGLHKGSLPIRGVAILLPESDDSILMLSVRLPSDLGALIPAIIADAEAR